MPFDLTGLSPEVSAILALEGNGDRLMPLTAGACCSPEAALRVQSASAGELFPGARSPEGALAGLWVYFSAFHEAHAVAQDLATREGSYWHAIVHRQEPDAWNSQYWFSRVGRHAIFSALAAAVGEAEWIPSRFIELCDVARRKPGSPEERRALELQRLEWQLLFRYCAARATMK
jgi:hypothetical protein